MMGRSGGRVNRNIKTDSVGKGSTPRLKGNSSTTNVGKGTKSGGRSDMTDQTSMKRGDSKAGKASNYLTDSTKASRSSTPLSKMPPQTPIKKPLSRGE